MSKRQASSSKPIFTFFPKTKKLETSASEFYKEYLPNATANSNISQDIRYLQEERSVSDENEILKAENTRLKSELEIVTAECTQLKAENNKLLRDLKSVKKLLNETSVLSATKEIKLKILEKKSDEQMPLYDDYSEILSDAVLKELRKLAVSRRSDSTFVLKIMRQLYSENIQDLQMVTACGRAENGLIPAEKRTILQKMFTERLASLNLKESEWIERYSRLNELMNSAINNINRQNVSQCD